MKADNYINPPQRSKNMELNILEHTKKRLVFELKGADHTFCNLLKNELWQDKDVKKGLEMGADIYLIKAHYTPSQVVEKVEEILNKVKM